MIDFIGPNDDETEPEFDRGYICFNRTPEHVVLICSGDSKSEVSIQLNNRDLELLRQFADQAMRPRPQIYAYLGFLERK